MAVAQYGSFTAAASSLFMVQSTLSRQVSALERELGVALFQRGTRATVPTAAGAAFLVEAEVAVAALDRAERAVRNAVIDLTASAAQVEHVGLEPASE
jgi:DNA-binding transcriptional LysR family regulator